MHEYDVILKLLLKRSAHQTLRQLTDVAIERWLPIELPKIQNLRVDLLGEAVDGTLVQLELQSSNDRDMPLRMAEYLLGIYRHFARFAQQIVVYVGRDPLRMADRLQGPCSSFEYTLIDIRELNSEALLGSAQTSDNVIGVLANLQNRQRAVADIVRKIGEADVEQRAFYLQALLTLAGLRGLEEMAEREARKVPILESILDNKVLGREFKRGLQEGELALLRRQIEKRFGNVPAWAEERLQTRSAAELEDLGVRLLDVESLEELLK